MSKVLMSEKIRAEHMRKSNTFQFIYNIISLNKTKNIDIPFKLPKEECREIGFGDQSSSKEVAIRSIINSWRASYEDKRRNQRKRRENQKEATQQVRKLRQYQ